MTTVGSEQMLDGSFCGSLVHVMGRSASRLQVLNEVQALRLCVDQGKLCLACSQEITGMSGEAGDRCIKLAKMCLLHE